MRYTSNSLNKDAESNMNNVGKHNNISFKHKSNIIKSKIPVLKALLLTIRLAVSSSKELLLMTQFYKFKIFQKEKRKIKP